MDIIYNDYDDNDVINECHLLNSSNEQLKYILSFLSPKSLAGCKRYNYYDYYYLLLLLPPYLLLLPQ